MDSKEKTEPIAILSQFINVSYTQNESLQENIGNLKLRHQYFDYLEALISLVFLIYAYFWVLRILGFAEDEFYGTGTDDNNSFHEVLFFTPLPMSFFRPSNRLAIPLYGTIRCIFISQQRPAFFYSSWVNSIKRQAVERKDLSFSLIQSRRVESDSSAILTALIKENCYVTKGVPSLKNLKVFTFFGIISVTTALNSFGNVAYCVDLNQGTGSVNHLFASASTAASSTPTNPPYHDAPELTVPTNGNEGNQPNFASKMTKIMLGLKAMRYHKLIGEFLTKHTI
ncbi:hypothetical protein G9A89_002278 [Geosiphon pyriformis]|nr:hypothetical protein G9A89_002278 [Geosiphon pyriformis]